MNCKNCNREIPDDANLCSYCGISTNGQILANQKKKKSGCLFIFLGIIGFFVVLAIIGSQLGENTPSNKTSKDQQNTEEAEKSPIKMGEAFKSKAFEITITGKEAVKKVNDKSGFIYSEADGIFVAVHVHYKNIADSAKRLDSSAFKLTADGKEYTPTILAVNYNENIFHDQVNPGIEKDGIIYFDVPESVVESNLTLKLSSSFLSDNFNGEVELY